MSFEIPDGGHPQTGRPTNVAPLLGGVEAREEAS